MRSSSLATVLLALGLAVPAHAQPSEPEPESSETEAPPAQPAPTALPTTPLAPGIRTIARVLATGDVDGRFAHPVCDHREHLRQEDHAAFTYALMREANAEDRPLIVDTGGLLAPHGVARFSAERHPESLATMVQRVGYRALALGLNDLAAPRDGLVAVARELRARRVPIVASNLRCAPEQRALCDQLVDASDGVSTHVVNGRLTAFIAVLRQNALHSIAPDLAEGLELEDPRETIERFTRLARERGAQLVVAVVDGRLDGGPIELATQIEPEARPDLVLVSSYDELLFARPRTVRPVLVGTLERETVEVRIRESAEIMDGYEMLAQPLEGRGITVAEPVLDWIDEIGQEYCDAWGRPLQGAHLEDPIDVEGMLDMVAEIMRYETGADVAVINRQALDQRWRAAQEGSLTASDVYIALEYDEPLQVATVDERWLQALARQAEDTGNLVTPGMKYEIDGTSTSVSVGGHATASRQDYRVVTLRFLAAGGDEDLIPPLPNDSEWETLEGDTGTLRGMVLDHLDQPRQEDPRVNLPSTEEVLEWTFGASVDVGVSGSTIENPLRECTAEELAMMPSPCNAEGQFLNDDGDTEPRFRTTQLLLREVLSFSLASQFFANAAAPDWTWESTASFAYRTTWASSTNSFFESQDQIRGRSNLSWRGLRDQDADQWFVPDPTVGLFVESEFTQAPIRDWHWLLFRPTIGGRFQLLDKLQLALSFGMQVQLLEDPELDPGAGVGATLTLEPWDFLTYDERFARLSFTFDYFLNQLGEQYDGVLRGQLDASFDLAGPLAIVTSFSLLMQHEGTDYWGASLNATVGLQLSTVGRTTGP